MVFFRVGRYLASVECLITLVFGKYLPLIIGSLKNVNGNFVIKYNKICLITLVFSQCLSLIIGSLKSVNGNFIIKYNNNLIHVGFQSVSCLPLIMVPGRT